MVYIWNEIKKAVQLHSEHCFEALRSWRDYADAELIKNRLQLLEAVQLLFIKHTISYRSYSFFLTSTHGKRMDANAFLPEIHPTLGLEYVPEGDLKTFSAIQDCIEPDMFKFGGIFFQDVLLHCVSGFDEHTMKEANATNRDSLTALMHQIFSLSESAGFVYIRFSPKSGRRIDVQLQEIQSSRGKDLFELLSVKIKDKHSEEEALESNIEQSAAALSSTVSTIHIHNTPTPVCNDEVAAENKHDDAHGDSEMPPKRLRTEGYLNQVSPHSYPASSSTAESPPFVVPAGSDCTWSSPTSHCAGAPNRTTVHTQPPHTARCSTRRTLANPLVGTHLAARRAATSTPSCSGTPGEMRAGPSDGGSTGAYVTPARDTHGRVIRVTPASHGSPAGTDADNTCMHRVLWEEPVTEGWTTDHPSIGQHVAAVFPQPRRLSKSFMRQIVALSQGEAAYSGYVRKYQPPSCAGAGDQLYHVRWCDGDSEDFDEEQLQIARALYRQHSDGFQVD